MNSAPPRKIAVVGAGVSGMSAAWLLSRRGDFVTLLEGEAGFGGHARTLLTPRGTPVDTGFIVFNYRNYPHLNGLFEHLRVPVEKSDMSFSITVDEGRFEYGCQGLNMLLAQRRNALSPAYWGMIRDIFRFNKRALPLARAEPDLSLGALLERLKLGENFRRYFLLPIGGAVWSCPRAQMLEFPALAFLEFFNNHGLLSAVGQPQWWTVTGGSREYVRRLLGDMPQVAKRSAARVRRITRLEGGGVEALVEGEDSPRRYDAVVIAAHSDQALAMLEAPDAEERAILGAIRYGANRAVLHADEAQMPRRRAAWASWVYRADSTVEEKAVSVTYWMNRLQNINAQEPLFVTLNPTKPIAPEKIIDAHTFHHPIFDGPALKAQARLGDIQGRGGVWYCGAWARHGFHEDGIWSAVRVAREMGASTPW